jgi:hypothetical protein
LRDAVLQLVNNPEQVSVFTIVAVSDVIECSAGVRWLGNKTAATVVAAC